MDEREQKKSGMGIGDGIRTGLGVLGAFKDAIEETLQEAVNRGDLTPDRATRAMRDAAQRLQAALEDTRGRMDLVSRKEHDELRAEVAALRERLDRHERGGAGGPGPDADGGEPGGTTPSGIIVTD
jgi:polyhydroxyalkanoate synthesis regulator phasin